MDVHPNYATFLIDKQSVGMTKIFEMLNKLPEDSRHLFFKHNIENVFYNEMRNCVEDSQAIAELTSKVSGREILVIAPGISVKTHSNKIAKFIESARPFVISLNFIPDDISPDLVFISNRKRFEQIGQISFPIAVTSNINASSGTYVIDYDSLLQDDSDTSGIMGLRFLMRLGVKRAILAGYDGFTDSGNYYNECLDNYMTSEAIMDLNKIISGHLSEIGKTLTIDFITPSIYEVKGND